MACKCGSKRLMFLYMKHNDLTSLEVPHLNIDVHSDYFPSLGGFIGGDDTQFDVCLDCGKIQGWKEISDGEIMTALQIDEVEVKEEDDYVPPKEPELLTLSEYMAFDKQDTVDYIQFTYNKNVVKLEVKHLMSKRDHFANLLQDTFGKGWRGAPEVYKVLQNTIHAPQNVDEAAIASMLMMEIL